MNLFAIVESPRKGKAIDTLVGKAIEGAMSKTQNYNVKKIYLIMHDIQFCKNCFTCRENKTHTLFARCSIRDDMDHISEDVLKSDALIYWNTCTHGICNSNNDEFS